MTQDNPPSAKNLENVEVGRFGHWIVLAERVDEHKVLCRCSCGVMRHVFFHNLKRGLTKSCGCKGDPLRFKFKKERRAWSLLKHRCNCPTSADYPHYGARGISVCSRWLSFENFLADMGPMPFKRATVERIDVDGNYEAGNCKWATVKEQARNKRNTRWLETEGGKMCLTEVANNLGMGISTLRERLKRGWSLERAMNTPVGIGKEKWKKKKIETIAA